MKNKTQIILQRKIVNDVWDASHWELSDVLIVMIEIVSVHYLEKLVQILHYLLVICLHYNWQCIKQVLKFDLVKEVLINRLLLSILGLLLICKFLQSLPHPISITMLFGVFDDTLKQWPCILTLKVPQEYV